MNGHAHGAIDMGYQRPVEVVTGHGAITAAARAQILGGTARRLLRLGE
jgi:hypothetical protein